MELRFTVVIYAAQELQLVPDMSFTGSKTNSLNDVVFDSENRLLIAAGGARVTEDNRAYTVRELMAWNLPHGNVRWHVVEPAKERIAYLAIRPITNELATKGTGDITMRSSDGKPLRNVESGFLAGPIVFSPCGQLMVAPQGNEVKVRSSDSGQIVATLPISESTYTSARAAVFVPGTTHLVVAATVIGNKGQTSGQLFLCDIQRQEVLKTAMIEAIPGRMAVDPRGRWACLAGQQRRRGHLLCWDLNQWKSIAAQGAHGSSLDSVVVSPDGEQLATTGSDHVIRIWDTATWKTVTKLDKHVAKDKTTACIAWSPNGQYLAYASIGEPPLGCVAVYARDGDEWKLASPDSEITTAGTDSTNLRPLQIFNDGETMSADSTPETGSPPVPPVEDGSLEWLYRYLDKHRSNRPMTTKAHVQEWERKHNIALPPSYVDFVTTMGRCKFPDVMAREGYSVRILGPNELDAHEYRCDPPESAAEDGEPDGLLFAVAINGDGFCFDLRGDQPERPVVHFDHETDTFEPFAANFAASIRRFVERS